MFRDETKKVMIGNVCVGGGSPVVIQSMTNTKTQDVQWHFCIISTHSAQKCPGAQHRGIEGKIIQ